MDFENKLKCTTTVKTSFTKDKWSCNSHNVIYLIQLLGSANNFKQRFRIGKYEIKTNKDLSGTDKPFKKKYCNPNNKHVYLYTDYRTSI